MSVPARVIKEWEESQGVDRLGPIVTFYDHAMPANKSARDWLASGKWKGERPRFKAAVFVEMKTRNDPTGSTFCQAATETDKEKHSREWAKYCADREQIEHRAPPLAAIPSMNPAAFEELRALGVHECRQLAQYEGDLDALEPMREVAIRIMEAASEDNHEQQNRGIRGERESIPQGVERPVHSEPAGADRAGGTGPASGVLRPSTDTARGFPAGTSATDGIGPTRELPSHNQSREPVQEQPEGRERLLRDTSVEVFHYDLMPS